MVETSYPRIDVPQAYEAHINLVYMELQDGADFEQKRTDYTEAQQKLLADEAYLLNIDPTQQPDRFVEAHNALLSEAEGELNERLPEVKQAVIEKAAAYFSDGEEDTQKAIVELLMKRLADTKRVIVADSLAYPKAMAGIFNGAVRQPVIVSEEIVKCMQHSDSLDEYRDRISNVILAHEVIHGIMTSGVQDIWLMSNYSIRNGLQVIDVENPMSIDEMKNHIYGTWINEALIESFRQTIMETHDVRYEPAVMVLHMLEAFKPGLRDRLMEAALDSSGPGPVFGEVESLLGPTAISDLEWMLAVTTNLAELEPFKEQVAQMLPEEIRKRGRSILEQKQEEVFSWRSDYREKRNKALAEIAAQKASS